MERTENAEKQPTMTVGKKPNGKSRMKSECEKRARERDRWIGRLAFFRALLVIPICLTTLWILIFHFRPQITANPFLYVIIAIPLTYLAKFAWL
jgi:hypothetical protein